MHQPGGAPATGAPCTSGPIRPLGMPRCWRIWSAPTRHNPPAGRWGLLRWRQAVRSPWPRSHAQVQSVWSRGGGRKLGARARRVNRAALRRCGCTNPDSAGRLFGTDLADRDAAAILPAIRSHTRSGLRALVPAAGSAFSRAAPRRAAAPTPTTRAEGRFAGCAARPDLPASSRLAVAAANGAAARSAIGQSAPTPPRSPRLEQALAVAF
jgi:hypothetical protein